MRLTLEKDSESDSEPVPIPKSSKKRFSIEKEDKYSDLKRKGKIALGSFAEGISDPLSLIMSVMQPGASIASEKSKIKNVLQEIGIDSPETESKAEEYIEAVSRGAGSGIGFGPISAGAGAVTAAAGKGLKDFGVPEPIADIAEVGLGFLSPSGLSKSGKIPSAFQKSAQVIQKEGLPKVRGILKKPFEKIKPITSEASLKNFERKIEKSVQESSERILEEALLGKQLEKQGTVIGDLIEDAYGQAEKIGKTISKQVDLNKASTILGIKADSIEKSAASLSGPSEEIVKKLRKYQKDFSGKRMTPDQFQNQWKEVNIDLNNLYRKPELSGAEEKLRKTLEDTKDILMKEAQSQFKNPEYINSFKQANKLYSESRKLDKVSALFEPVFDKGFNANRFRSIFQNPKKYHELSQSIGSQKSKRLHDISKYYVDPIEKMKKTFKLKNMVDVEEILGSGIVANVVGMPVAIGKVALMDIPPRIASKLMMNENTQSIWMKLMKSIQHGSPKLIQKYVQELENDLSEPEED